MPGLLPFSMAYWSLAASIMRQVSSVAVAWERLRARRKLGTAMAASSAMIATTIMISTRVKPPRRDWSLFNITSLFGIDYFVGGDRSRPALRLHLAPGVPSADASAIPGRGG